MSSIAYISDQSMIQFHRLHGHDEINFWRISTRDFSDFSTNDFLFFLIKTTRKERGIIGYGKLYDSEDLSVKKMWEKYGTKNGYASYEELHEAISRANKKEVFPGKCNCLLLKNVVFFEAPVYLSEFGFELSSNLESFTYIDKVQDTTTKILNAADRIGVDLWTKSTTSSKKVDFEFEKEIHQLSNWMKPLNIYTSKQHKNLANQIRKKVENSLPLASSPNLLYNKQHDITILYLPMVTFTKKDTLSVYGLMSSMREEFDHVQVVCVTRKVVKQEAVDFLARLDVKVMSLSELE